MDDLFEFVVKLFVRLFADILGLLFLLLCPYWSYRAFEVGNGTGGWVFIGMFVATILFLTYRFRKKLLARSDTGDD